METEQIFLVGTVVFALLVIVLTAVLTWAIRLVYENNNCQLDPNIWCYNDWTCQNTSSTPGVNPCFGSSNPTPNLTECIYGPTGTVTNTCFGGERGSDPSVCACAISDVPNCLNGCPGTATNINQSTCPTYNTN